MKKLYVISVLATGFLGSAAFIQADQVTSAPTVSSEKELADIKNILIEINGAVDTFAITQAMNRAQFKFTLLKGRKLSAVERSELKGLIETFKMFVDKKISKDKQVDYYTWIDGYRVATRTN
ncbi:MAG: hypothetical protein NTX86_05840 [Candidatus Dependentiae bacterium]|nr:hypothetical protein [Candidatus Dependentiae bacterium]